MSRYHKGKNGFVRGVLFGSVIGGITALLFAPKTGDKMRKELAKKYQDVSDKACDIFEDVCDQTDELVEKAKEVACSAKEVAQKFYRKG